MSFFSHPEKEVVISSPFEGKITFKGEPATGAKVLRTLTWKDEKGETDTTMTDGQGYFKLPIVKDKVTVSKLTQFIMSQTIRVFYNGQEYVIWTMGKGSTENYGELGGKPVNFRCELTNDRERIEVEDGLLGTVCVWDSIELKE